MKTKTFEIRDSATFIPVLAVKLDGETDYKDNYLLDRAGLNRIGSYKILVYKLSQDYGTMDFYKWTSFNGDSRTMPIAHQYIEDHFDALETGSVIDVEFILGETSVYKISERNEHAQN